MNSEAHHPCLGLLKNHCTMHSCHNKYLHCFHCRGTAHNYQGSCEELSNSSKTKIGDALPSKPFNSYICLHFGVGDPEREIFISYLLISDKRYVFVYKNSSFTPVTSQLCSVCFIMLSYHAMFSCCSYNFLCVQLLIASSCMHV